MPTAIEWTDETWNPIRARLRADPTRIGWHCEHVSPGCEHCYAETLNLAGRSQFTGTRLAYKPGHRKDVEIFVDEKTLLRPLHWKQPRKIFVCSMTDLFADFVTDGMIDQVFAVMALCHHHTFQVLTKRPERAREYLTSPSTWPRISGLLDELKPSDLWNGNVVEARFHTATRGFLPNVWLGVSVEDQQRADERIPDLLTTPAAVRWLSCEPLLGPVDLTNISTFRFRGAEVLNALTGTLEGMFGDYCATRLPRIDWVVAGGESGPGARPMHPALPRSLRDQCAAAGVPYLMKQWGAWAPGAGSREQRWVEVDGRSRPAADALPSPSAIVMTRSGKKAAGRLLDGVQHDGYPQEAAHG